MKGMPLPGPPPTDQGSAGDNSLFHKTRMCRDFRNGNCAAGDRCRYAHGEHELRPLSHEGQQILDRLANRQGGSGMDRDRREDRGTGGQPMCKDFMQGRCRHGDHCKFSHGGADGGSRERNGPRDQQGGRGGGPGDRGQGGRGQHMGPVPPGMPPMGVPGGMPNLMGMMPGLGMMMGAMGQMPNPMAMNAMAMGMGGGMPGMPGMGMMPGGPMGGMGVGMQGMGPGQQQGMGPGQQQGMGPGQQQGMGLGQQQGMGPGQQQGMGAGQQQGMGAGQQGMGGGQQQSLMQQRQEGPAPPQGSPQVQRSKTSIGSNLLNPPGDARPPPARAAPPASSPARPAPAAPGANKPSSAPATTTTNDRKRATTPPAATWPYGKRADTAHKPTPGSAADSLAPIADPAVKAEVGYIERVRATCGILNIGNAAAFSKERPELVAQALTAVRSRLAYRANAYADDVGQYLPQPQPGPATKSEPKSEPVRA